MATIVRHLLYEGGRLVARGSARLDIPAGSYRRSQQTLDLARPSLWSPRSPALYRLVTLIESASGVDRTETRIGIRRIARCHGGDLEILCGASALKRDP